MNNSDTEISIDDLSDYWIRGPVAVVHCGAHLAEELEEYEGVGWRQIIWIEANPKLIPPLTKRLLGHDSSKVVSATLWSTSGKALSLQVANNSYSSSILDFGTHAETYPDITFESEIEVQTQTLDSILAGFEEIKGGFLVLDLQGVEFEALQGATDSLSKFDYIYTEVSESNLYQNQGNWNTITKFLAGHNFKLVDWQYSTGLNWGNALYQRRPRLIQSHLRRSQRIKGHRKRLQAN